MQTGNFFVLESREEMLNIFLRRSQQEQEQQQQQQQQNHCYQRHINNAVTMHQQHSNDVAAIKTQRCCEGCDATNFCKETHNVKFP